MVDGKDSRAMSIHDSRVSNHFAKLCDIVAKLRAPGGCPWDREQTHESLLPQLIEETYEVAGAVRANDTVNFREELGDLLLHVVMHAEIAHESGQFQIDDVVNEVTEKLIRRHPHVFAKSDAQTSGAVLRQWEAIKREEKRKTHAHYLDGLPAALPALIRAQKAQAKAARVNFDWTELGDVIAKIDEELGEARAAIEKWHRHLADDSRAGSPCHEVEDEIGDLLFAVVNLARKCKLDAESTLQRATDKFVGRFNRLEDELHTQGKQLGEVGLEELDKIWNKIKKTPNIQRPTSNVEAI
jgi:MazG family protein